jgi:hypothetical protein
MPTASCQLRLLDGHFADRRGAYLDVRFVVQPLVDVGGERGVVRKPPQQHVRSLTAGLSAMSVW